MTDKPIAEGIFTWPSDDPRLIGGRHRASGSITFPMPVGALAKDYAPIELKAEGTLWSYTVQRFPPKSPPYAGDSDPKTFKPYAVGYVELAGEVIVETRIETEHFASLKVGTPMRLVIVPFGRDAKGDTLLTYAFRPAAEHLTHKGKAA